MSPAKWLGAAFVLFLAAGVALVAVPAASVSGLRLTAGAPVKVAGSLVTVPVQISNQGFLGIAVSGLQVKVVDDGAVLLSHGIGSVDIPPGGKVVFQVPFLNVSSPAPVIGNLSGEVTGEAEVGGIVPVSLDVSARVVTAAESPAAGGALAASWSAALLAAGAVAKAGDGGGREARRGRALQWCGGAGMAAAYVAVLVVAPRLAGGAVGGVVSLAAGAGAGLVIVSGFSDFVMSAPYAALLVAVAAVEAVLKGSELGAAGKGWLKAAEGALLALTFYLLFGGGTTPVDLYFGTVAADFSVGLLLPLVLLEMAAGSRLAQGVVEAGVFSGSGRKGEDGARQRQADAADVQARRTQEGDPLPDMDLLVALSAKRGPGLTTLDEDQSGMSEALQSKGVTVSFLGGPRWPGAPW